MITNGREEAEVIENKFKLPEEWFKQADYDLETAEVLFRTGRYIYAVFMCHLSVEKALKGLYARRFGENPPKIHDLIYLTEKIGLMITEGLNVFLEDLNDLSIPARYPDDLEKLLQAYDSERTKKILNQTKELLSWLKKVS